MEGYKLLVKRFLVYSLILTLLIPNIAFAAGDHFPYIIEDGEYITDASNMEYVYTDGKDEDSTSMDFRNRGNNKELPVVR